MQAWLHGIEDVRGADCVPVAMEQHDRAALIALYEATGGPNWKKSENWLSDAPLSDWHGVTTDRNGRVMELNLWSNNLRGPFPVELGRLSNLKFVCLDGNRLTGPLPTSWEAPTYLRRAMAHWQPLHGATPGRVVRP